jgi:hypothetical protein
MQGFSARAPALPQAALSRAGLLNHLVRVAGHSVDLRAMLRIARKGILPSTLRPPNGGLLFLRLGIADRRARRLEGAN